MFNMYTENVYGKQFDPVNYLSHYPFAVIRLQCKRFTSIVNFDKGS